MTEKARPTDVQRQEGIPLPCPCGVPVARVENFDDLDVDCANDSRNDAYCILAEMEEAFIGERCRLTTDEADVIPALIDVQADLDNEKPIRAYFGFSRFVPDEETNRLITYYRYKYTK